MTDSAEAPTPKPKRKPTKPQGLDKAGSKLWREIITSGTYELRPDEVRILEDACREADLIDQMAEAMKYADFMVTGSQGQDVINPLIPELRQHRSTFAALIGKLKLPDDEPAGQPEASPRSVSARNAANARWDTTG